MEWIALFKNVGNRNASAMANLSPTLLERGLALTRAQTEYLPMAGMTGLIVKQDNAAAQQLRKKYANEIARGGKPSLVLRLLDVHSCGVKKPTN
jgi:hypothetical protein